MEQDNLTLNAGVFSATSGIISAPFPRNPVRPFTSADSPQTYKGRKPPAAANANGNPRIQSAVHLTGSNAGFLSCFLGYNI